MADYAVELSGVTERPPRVCMAATAMARGIPAVAAKSASRPGDWVVESSRKPVASVSQPERPDGGVYPQIRCYCDGASGRDNMRGVTVVSKDQDWTKPAMMAIPKEGYFEEQRGRYGPIFPRTPACYGFTIFAKVIPGREEVIREHGRTLEAAVTADPTVLAPLKLHYLKWQLIPVGEDLYFQYQGIFDTDFDKYTEDAVRLFSQSGITTTFENLEGFPLDWRERPEGFVEFVRAHHVPSFIEYGEYPYVTSDEIKKALRLKDAFSDMLDQMQ